MTTYTLTAPQHRAAVALAAAHGHDWARHTVGQAERALGRALEDGDAVCVDRQREYLAACRAIDEALTSGTVPLALIGAATENADLDGIQAPTLDSRGRVVHTTATGRLRWTVERDGSVYLEVARPHPDVAALRRIEQHAAEPEDDRVLARLLPVARAHRAACAARGEPVESDWGDAVLAALQYARRTLQPRVVLRAVVRSGRAVVTHDHGAETRHVDALEVALLALGCDPLTLDATYRACGLAAGLAEAREDLDGALACEAKGMFYGAEGAAQARARLARLERCARAKAA